MTTTRGRDGDLVEQADAPATFHDPRCDQGWLPSTVDERPVPCTTCRPHVARTQDLLRRQRLRPDRRATPHVQAAAMATIRAELARARTERTEAPR